MTGSGVAVARQPCLVSFWYIKAVYNIKMTILTFVFTKYISVVISLHILCFFCTFSVGKLCEEAAKMKQMSLFHEPVNLWAGISEDFPPFLLANSSGHLSFLLAGEYQPTHGDPPSCAETSVLATCWNLSFLNYLNKLIFFYFIFPRLQLNVTAFWRAKNILGEMFLF